ncbi:MAG: ABC transporter permease [Deltaproteobacteria bacterium]|jgi:ABC-2 type transport system permease protein|nr:ABC transporter permease [Deltaproteobacteria bacterium]
MRILKALIKKEFSQVARDPATIGMTFALPLVLMFIFGYGVNLDVGSFRVGIVVEGDEPRSGSLIAAFGDSRFFEIVTGRDIREFEGEMTASRLKGIVVIPADFSRSLNSGQKTSILLVTDGSDGNTATLVKAYAQMAIINWREGLMAERGLSTAPLIGLETRSWYNPGLVSRQYLLPGSIAVILTITGVIMTALVIAREWERGTMESLMATPAGIYQILTAKLLTYFVLAVFSMLLCWGTTIFWYGVPFKGSFLAFMVIGSFYLVTALGQGLLISTLTKNQYLAAELAFITGFLPSFLLSGVIFEISSMPAFLQAVTLLVPARYFVTALKTIFLAGNVWPILLCSTVMLAILGLAFFLLTAWKTVKKLA